MVEWCSGYHVSFTSSGFTPNTGRQGRKFDPCLNQPVGVPPRKFLVTSRPDEKYDCKGQTSDVQLFLLFSFWWRPVASLCCHSKLGVDCKVEEHFSTARKAA